MDTIVSPQTTDRIVRTLLRAVLFTVFAAMFFYDGYIGYPTDNLEKAAEKLDPVPTETPPMHETLTADFADELTAFIEESRRTRSQIIEKLGEPGWESERRDEMVYFGQSGTLKVNLRGDLVLDSEFTKGVHDAASLATQKGIAFVLTPLALWQIIEFLLALTGRTTVTDRELKLRGQKPFTLTDIKSMDITLWDKKGIVELTYSDNGQDKQVKIDDYRIRDFRQVVERICTVANIENTLPPPKEKNQAKG